jgi:hypothetical protein
MTKIGQKRLKVAMSKNGPVQINWHCIEYYSLYREIFVNGHLFTGVLSANKLESQVV